MKSYIAILSVLALMLCVLGGRQIPDNNHHASNKEAKQQKIRKVTNNKQQQMVKFASWKQQSTITSTAEGPRSAWRGYHNPAPISEIKSKVRSSSSVDVAIVGAGYSGLVAARELSREGYKVAVVRGQ